MPGSGVGAAGAGLARDDTRLDAVPAGAADGSASGAGPMFAVDPSPEDAAGAADPGPGGR